MDLRIVHKMFVQLCVLCLCFLVSYSNAKTIPSDGLPGSSCQMGGNVTGQCEEVQQCLRDGGVVQKLGQVKLCQAKQNKIYVCCRKPQRIAEELCTAWAGYWRKEDQSCIKNTPLIRGGVDASVGEFPHIALVGHQEIRGTITRICGGSLVSPHYVLTAAHCVKYDELQYWVELGVHDLSFNPEQELPRIKGAVPRSLYRAEDLERDTTQNVPVQQRVKVIEVTRHPHYQEARRYHDIALLKLERPVTLTKLVLPACLPIPTQSGRDIRGDDVVVAGWGMTGPTSLSELSGVLQKVTVPVKELLQCQPPLAEHGHVAAAFGLLEDQLCAGADGKDSCPGDSGGPLMTQVPRGGAVCEHTVDGVVSFGIGCGTFGIYVRVSAYLDWITGYIAPNAL